MIRISFAITYVLISGAALQARTLRPSPDGMAQGLGINVPIVGRLIGGGNTLFVTAMDISNNSAGDVQIDFYLDGLDVTKQTPISVAGSIGAGGVIAAQGSGGNARARSNAHFDDFIDALVKANMLDPSIESDGFLGSALFVFNGFTKRGQGSVTARFANNFSGGTIGVSLRGHELTTNEPKMLVAAVRDSRGKSGPQLYANVFINNTGFTPTSSGGGGAVDVQITAYANSTGQQVGNPMTVSNIGVGQTASVGNILQALGVPSGEDTILIYATVVSGNSAIEGIVSQVDAVTKDGSAFEMSRADF